MRSTGDIYKDLSRRGRTAEQIRCVAIAWGNTDLQRKAELNMAIKMKKKAQKTEGSGGAEIEIPEQSDAAWDASKEKIQRICIDKIKPSVLNRQIAETSADLDQLAESMQNDGLIQPIVVRPVMDQEQPYEIVCGERRWRAARKLNWGTIPCIVRDIDLHEAQVQRLVENLQRLDVPPLEQSEGVAVLLSRFEDPAEVGKRLGQSEQWVRIRAKLSNLSPTWRAELSDPDTDYDRMAMFVGWQEQIARLPKSTQDMLHSGRHLYNCMTAEALSARISEYLRRISDAPWPLEAEKAIPKAQRCASCDKRSDREATLFRDLEQEDKPGAVCLDPQCWERKVAVWLRGLVRQARQDHPDLVALFEQYWVDQETQKELPDGMLAVTKQHWLSVEEYEQDGDQKSFAKAWGIFLVGDRRGEVVECWVMAKDADDDEAPASGDDDGDDRDLTQPQDEVDAVEAARNRLLGMVKAQWPCPALELDDIDLENKTQLTSELVTVSAIAAVIGCGGITNAESYDANERGIQAWLDTTLEDATLRPLVEEMTEAVHAYILDWGVQSIGSVEDFKALAKFMGYDWDKLLISSCGRPQSEIDGDQA